MKLENGKWYWIELPEYLDYAEGPIPVKYHKHHNKFLIPGISMYHSWKVDSVKILGEAVIPEPPFEPGHYWCRFPNSEHPPARTWQVFYLRGEPSPGWEVGARVDVPMKHRPTQELY